MKKECRTNMLHSDIHLSTLTLYVQEIEESKLRRFGRDLKRGMFEDQFQARFKKRAQNEDVTSVPKFDLKRSFGYQLVSPYCLTCGKRYHEKYLSGTSGCNGCGKNDHEVRDYPTIATRRGEAKNLLVGVRFLFLQIMVIYMLSKITRKKNRMKVVVSYSFYFFVLMGSF